MNALDDLENLLTEAVLEASTKPKKPAKHTETRAVFTKPENWLLRQQVRLTHEEGNVLTLIGLFDEFVHVSVLGCRRLVAAHQLNEALPQVGELVHGPHWLPAAKMDFKRQPSERTVQLCIPIILDMGQHLTAEAVLVEAHLAHGGLQRLNLQEDTVFEGNTPRTILQLPAGMDILEGVLGGCKVRIWRKIQEEADRGAE